MNHKYVNQLNAQTESKLLPVWRSGLCGCWEKKLALTTQIKNILLINKLFIDMSINQYQPEIRIIICVFVCVGGWTCVRVCACVCEVVKSFFFSNYLSCIIM